MLRERALPLFAGFFGLMAVGLALPSAICAAGMLLAPVSIALWAAVSARVLV